MKKLLISLLLLVGGSAIFVFGSPYYSVFPTNGNLLYCLALAFFFLILAIVFRLVKSWVSYWPAAYALFTASAALLFLNTGLLNLHNPRMPDLQYLAFDKLSQFLHVVPVILLLTLPVKDRLKSIFLKRGNLKQGLLFGLISFAVFALIAILIGSFSGNEITSLLMAAPWILIFIFCNAIMEELWFRAIFLKSYELLIGRIAAILVTALVFGASHINVTYEFPGGGVVFGIVVFGLGVAGAWSMFKTDSLIGALLFHAGYDLVIIGSVLNTL